MLLGDFHDSTHQTPVADPCADFSETARGIKAAAKAN
jgi:hypothetical protein